jgi:hypothetical protein
MHDVQDVALHCLGVDAPGAEEKWLTLDAPPGHRNWDHGGTYRHARSVDLEYDDDVEFRLNHWVYDYPRFTRPFYYGLAGGGMVYMLMFDRSCTPEDEIRFSLFKFKLKRFPRPAWDFEYVVHPVQEDKDYGFRGRAVWKRFISPEDCLREYEIWKARKP